MIHDTRHVLALDIGEKRIGIAKGDTSVKIAIPLKTLVVDGTEATHIASLVANEAISTVVVGYPRNQSGEATAQTAYVEHVVDRLASELAVPIVFCDESLTSVIAEDRLQRVKKPYTKADIDAMAACIILEQYLEGTA